MVCVKDSCWAMAFTLPAEGMGSMAGLNRNCEARHVMSSRWKWIAHFFFVILIIGSLFPPTCIASDQQGGVMLPQAQENKVFGVTCPPGMCRIPQGFLLSRRDKMFGMHFIDDKRGWIVGAKGFAIVTPDGGESWQQMTISEDAFNDIFFVGKKGWIVGDGGLILHTDDEGGRWHRQTSNVRECLMSVFFVDEEMGFIVGAGGRILKTEDGGSSWQTVFLDLMERIPDVLIERGVFSITLYDVFFYADTSGCVVGDYGTIFYTLNGGERWDISQMGIFPSLFAVSFKNNAEGWAVGQDGFVVKTEDGGVSWQKISLDFDTEEGLYQIRMSGEYGVIVGDHGTVLKTSDGGMKWSKNKVNLRPPLPWFADAWILPSATSAKILCAGKGLILEKYLYKGEK